jgi:recombination protein RecA
VEKRGSFYTVGEQRIGQGRENARQALKDNPALLQELEARVRAGGLGLSSGAALEGRAPDGDD